MVAINERIHRISPDSGVAEEVLLGLLLFMIAVAVIIVAASILGWTLPGTPAFELTPDPKSVLPF